MAGLRDVLAHAYFGLDNDTLRDVVTPETRGRGGLLRPASHRADRVRRLLIGISWIVGACWFWFSLVVNPVDELVLIRAAQVAPGQIVYTWEDVDTGDDGRVHWHQGATYTYRLPDGRELTHQTTGAQEPSINIRDLELPYSVQVNTYQATRGSAESRVTAPEPSQSGYGERWDSGPFFSSCSSAPALAR